MYNLNFIRLFNPHLKNINQYQLLNILKNINPETKSKYNLILDINDFKNKYSEFDLQYYLIFNDDLIINLQSEVSVYLHYIKHGKNEERIKDNNSFLKEYKHYDYDFFYNINQKFINNIFYEKKDIINKYTNFGIDINSKTFREIYISKIYSIEYEINIKEKYNNKDCILNITDFNFKYPNIKIHFIAIFNEEYFPKFNKNTKITKELSYKIIKFYLDNKSKNINKVNLIFDEDDFYKKYPYFDIDIYKYFNNICDKEGNLYYLVNYHLNFSKGKILISCKEDFYKKYQSFDLITFKKFNIDYDKEDEYKCLYDYHINYDKDIKLLGSKEDFYNKYSDFDITIFKKFNSEYYNKSELECLYDYHNYRNGENTTLISNLDEFYSKYPDYNKDENIVEEEEIVRCLEFINQSIYDDNNNNKLEDKINELNFDYDFYINTYPDLKEKNINNKIKALHHYIKYGEKEGRKCNLYSFKNFYNLESNKSLNQNVLDKDINNIPENRINILIRNCYRPKLFKECIKSILDQDYRNLRILISYDNNKCLEYLNDYNDYRIEKYFVDIQGGKYKYELYCNFLKDKVDKGFIMFLDDDDKFINKNALKIINSYIKNNNDLILWNFLRPDMLINPTDLENIKYGEIASSGYIFNSKFKNSSKWEEKYGGDFSFFENLIKNNNFDKKYIDFNLTGTIENNRIGTGGKEELMNRKISIVMAYYNRREQLILTLDSYKKLYQGKYNFEVIIVDDVSNDEEKINDLQTKYEFVKIIELYEKEWINPVVPFNIGLLNISSDSDIIVLTSPEVFHCNDILGDILNNLNNNYLTYQVFASPSFEHNKIVKNLFENNETDYYKNFIDKINYEEFWFDYNYYKNNYEDINDMIYEEAYQHWITTGIKENRKCNSYGSFFERRVIKLWKGWLNHKVYNPRNLHFISAFDKNLLNKIGGFCEEMKDGLWYDDDDFLSRIKKVVDVKLIDDNLLGIHLYHKGGSSKNRFQDDFYKLSKKNYDIIKKNKIEINTNLKLKNNLSFSISSFLKSNSKKYKKSLIYYSKTEYEILFQRPQQIMRFFDKSYLKIFVGKIKEYKYEEKYNLFIVPYNYGIDLIKNIEKNIDLIIYYTDSRLYDEIIKFEGIKLFDLIDAPIGEFEVWKPNLKKCVIESDYVMYSHPDLINFLNEIDNTRKYNYISNGCDYEHFSKSKNRIGKRPIDFPNTNKPILGYYGAFSEWLDYDIIRKYADENNYHIVMIGGIKHNPNYNIRFEHENITWLDHKSYDELPYYLSWFDKCFLPFKECELTKYVNPCKLWEYLASEKEIIKHNVNIDVNKDVNMNINEVITYNNVCDKIYKILKININYKLSIVLLCFNKLKYTKQCITSILTNTNNCKYELIVVNNGSTDGTYKYLNEIKNDYIKIINIESNLGFSKGINIGVKNANGEYLILLNNDTIVGEDWVYSLIDILEKDIDVFAVTPITNSSGNESMLSFKHTSHQNYFFKYKMNIKENLNLKFEIKSLALFCGCFRLNDFINIGLLDENYLNGWEDDDLYERINLLNKKIIVSTQSCVYHFGSITVGKNNYSLIDNKNRLLFESKWNKKWVSHYSSKNILSEYYAILNLKPNNTIFSKTIYIMYTKYVQEIATNLQLLFKQLGIKVEIYKYILINDEYCIPESLNKENLFILLSPILVKKYPKYSIMFQMEQFSGQFVNKEYIEYMNKCMYVIDYSRTNVKYFTEYGFIKSNKIGFQQLNYNLNKNNNDDIYDYDIIFIGGVIGSKRRNNILAKLREHCKIYKLRFYIINDDNPKFGAEKIEIIKKSKIVINIHYNDFNCQLETPRILELISLNKIIISERSCVYDIEPITYDNSIFFIDMLKDDNSNFYILTNLIHYLKFQSNFNYFHKLIKKNNSKLLDNINRSSEFALKKNIFNILNSTDLGINKYVNKSGKIALITVNINNYDSIKINSSQNDWYYFTDTKTINNNKDKGLNYIFIDINNLNQFGININDLSHINPSSIAKLIKTKGISCKIFKKYQYIIWIDASIEIKINFDLKVNKLVSYDYDLYIFRHYKFENIYEEFLCASTLEKYYNMNNNLYEGIKNYTKNGISKGLYESGFIIYKNTPSIHKFTKDWFNEVNKYGNECQLSLPTVINNNNNLSIFNLNSLSSIKNNMEGNIWKNDMFEVRDHINSSYPRYDLNNKINYIDKILWINLDISKERFDLMTDLLSKVNIPSERVSGVNGHHLDKYSYSINTENNNLSSLEIACTLSHIKAILSLTSVEGEYFLIVEDDIILDNVYMFKQDLKTIINNCPSFDILMLYKTFIDGVLTKLYTNWNDLEFKPGGAVAYVISRKGINKFSEYNKININNEHIKFHTTKPFSVSDDYIYKYLNTYVFKYNYITTYPLIQSTIHQHSKTHLLVEQYNNLDMQYKYFYDDDN